MSHNTPVRRARSQLIRTFRLYLSRRWEAFFFLVVAALLSSQVFKFVLDIRSIKNLNGSIAFLASFQSFVAGGLSYVTIPAILLPLLYLIACRARPPWMRRFLDALGTYVIIRMFVQLIGLNILVFDITSSRFLLISQLLFFLPYSLLVWGWLYWRLDVAARGVGRPLFRLDIQAGKPRPIDYFIASFASVFSPSISSIKGNSARAKVLILGHGFLMYDVMGLTLSRAIALVLSP